VQYSSTLYRTKNIFYKKTSSVITQHRVSLHRCQLYTNIEILIVFKITVFLVLSGSYKTSQHFSFEIL